MDAPWQTRGQPLEGLATSGPIRAMSTSHHCGTGRPSTSAVLSLSKGSGRISAAVGVSIYGVKRVRLISPAQRSRRRRRSLESMIGT